VALQNTITVQQINILKYLYRERKFCSPTDVGIEIGQFSDSGRRRDSYWSVPKLQRLHQRGLVERSPAGMYRINYTGTLWLRDNGHIE
jgi:hypothetical protein